jgi:hypothetical protein
LLPATPAVVFAAIAASLSAQNPSTTPTGSASATPAAQDPKPVDWKDLTRSGIPLKFYGFLRLDAYYNTARMNSVVLPFTVNAEDGTQAKENDDQFMLDPRLTRFGFDVLPGKAGETQVNGKLEIDFANFPTGGTESRPTPRIRLAYMDLAWEETAVRLGQDWDVISPIFPSVNGETLMWNAGNTGDRRAQIQGRYVPKDSGFELRAALGLTGAVNNEDLDTPTGERDGFDSGMPHLQMRAAKKTDLLVDGKPAEFGAWGAFGQTQSDTAFNGETRFDVWIAGIDVQLPLCADCMLRGEGWTGQNLGDVRGGIGQTINTATGEEIASTGGWAELVWSASPKTRLHVGATIDDADNADVPANRPECNLSSYIGTVHDWDSGLRTGFDVLYWETDWDGLGVGTTIRFNLWFQYNF